MNDVSKSPSAAALVTMEGALLPAARAYAAAQYRVIELKYHDKAPSGSWAGPPLSDAELVTAFESGKANAGLVLGAPSNGLVDFDFDSEVAARIADSLLNTLPAFGRASSPRSHRLVLCDEARTADGLCKRVEFTLPNS